MSNEKVRRDLHPRSRMPSISHTSKKIEEESSKECTTEKLIGKKAPTGKRKEVFTEPKDKNRRKKKGKETS